MPWFMIHTKADGKYLKVYDSNGVEGDPGYRGKDARFWNFTHADEHCDHVEIPDKPSEDHIWNDSTSQWDENIAVIRARKNSELGTQAREDFFNASPEKARLIAALTEVSAAKSKSAIEAVTL